jgi:TP901 family phage tail tape measure protein
VALNRLGLGFLFTAKDMASGIIRRIGGGLLTLKGRAKSAGLAIKGALGIAAAGVTALVGGIAVLGLAIKSARFAAEFEFAMARVQSLSGATTAEFTALRRAALDAGIATQFTPVEAAKGLQELTVRGFSARDAIDSLRGVLALAVGGQISVGQAAQTTGAALRAFSLDTSETALTIDKLLLASKMSALQAVDLTLAIGSVGRGAKATKQTLDEMIMAISLVRDTGLEASTAAHSVSAALVYMSLRRDRFKALELDITDSAGEFKRFGDIIAETAAKLNEKYTNQADRAAIATRLFGKYGLTAYKALEDVMGKGIPNAAGEMVYGIEAIDVFREKLNNAAGTAKKMESILLNTFEGQERLIRGSIETLGTVIGEPFAKVFKPVVKLFIDVINTVIRAFDSLPFEARTALAAGIVIASVVSIAAGAFTLLAFAIAMVLPYLGTIATVMGVMTAAMAPLVVGLGVIVGAFVAIRHAYENNIGGMGDYFRNLFSKIKLAFQGVIQLFTQGGFTGAVRSEMMKAENSGILHFVTRIWHIGTRIIRFFRGVGEGISAGLEAASPVFKSLWDAISDLGRVLGVVGEEASGAFTQLSGGVYAEKGARVGMTIVRIFTIVAEVLKRVVRIGQGFVEGWTRIRIGVGGAIEELMPVLKLLWDKFKSVYDIFDTGVRASADSADGMRTWGTAIADFIGGSLSVLINFIRWLAMGIYGVLWVIDLFKTRLQIVGRFVTAVANGMLNAFKNLFDYLIAHFEIAAALFGKLATLLGDTPETKLVAEFGGAAQESLAGRYDRAAARTGDTLSGIGEIFRPSVATEESAVSRGVSADRLEDIMSRAADKAAASARHDPRPAIEVRLEVDGEELARTSANAQRSLDERGMRPVGNAP